MISKWLNTCGLSVTVLPSTLEAQFANGYRIGELLFSAYHAKRLKLMDESDFSRFVDDEGSRTASINNFLLLQPVTKNADHPAGRPGAPHVIQERAYPAV